MSTDVAQENPPFSSAWKELTDLGKRLLAKHISLKPGDDIPPEDRIEPIDSVRAGVGAKLLAQDGVSPDALARLSIFDLRILFDVYQGRFGQGDMVDYIGRVPPSSILLGQGFKQLVDQGMAPADALNTTIWRLRGTEPAVGKPPNIAFNADASSDEQGGQPGGSGTRFGANPPDPAAATSLAVSGVNAGDGSTAAARPAGSALRSDTAAQPYEPIQSVLDGASSLYARFGQGGPPNPAAAVTSDNALYSAEQAMDRLIRTWRTLAPTTSGSPLGSISPA
jgi:hypothetical protein